MLTGIIGYLLFVGLICLIAHVNDRNPIVWGVLAVVFTPVTSALGLFIYHNWIDDRSKGQ